MGRAGAVALVHCGILALACGSSSNGTSGSNGSKLGVGAPCTCAGQDAASGTDTLCGGAMYTACDASLSLYCVDGFCTYLCNAGKCPADYVCKDLPNSNEPYRAPIGSDGG